MVSELTSDTQQQALEIAPTNTVIDWINPDTGNSGYTKPTSIYTQGQVQCQEFLSVVMIGDQEEKAYGTACRMSDGSWQISPSKGSVVDNGNGTYTYMPAANENGADSFRVTVSDGTVDVSQTVAVTIIPATEFNSHDLAGTVISRGGGILSDVAITADMSNPSSDITTTSSSTGTFAMVVDNGASVSLLADMIHTNASPTKAITPQDALEALRLSVGLTTIGGSKTALDFMAADFNQNGKVTPQDALDILKYSVGLRELDTDWMFVDSAGDYSGITKGSVSFTEGVSITDMSADASVGLTGILLGDVNDTYTSYLDSSGTVV